MAGVLLRRCAVTVMKSMRWHSLRTRRCSRRGSKDGVVMLWDTRARAPAGGRRARLPRTSGGLELVPDSQTLLAIDDVWALSVIDMATLRSTALRLPATRSSVTPPNYYTPFDGTDTGRDFVPEDIGSRSTPR